VFKKIAFIIGSICEPLISWTGSFIEPLVDSPINWVSTFGIGHGCWSSDSNGSTGGKVDGTTASMSLTLVATGVGR